MTSALDDILDDHIAMAEGCRDLLPQIEDLARRCILSLDSGGKLLFCGNGGSAADCQHIATELTIRFEKNRKAMAAIALTTDTSTLTAAANDLGFARVFSRQVEALGRKGDILFGLTTSGTSVNVLTAFDQAKEQGLHTVCLTGRDGGLSGAHADTTIIVPSTNTARIQEAHIMIGHMLCYLLETSSRD